MTTPIDVAIVGAGPYGLAVGAYLKAANHEIQVFGKPMHFWRTQTPEGMLLRSPYVASSIGHPDPALQLAAFDLSTGAALPRPIPADQFVEYGDWFQQRALPEIDQREVTQVESTSGGFRLIVDDDVFEARRVVVAAGVGTFAFHPPQFTSLGSDDVSHTLDHRKLTVFADRRVAIIGGGQSALESAALLHEAGADAEVLMRSPQLNWLGRHPHLHSRYLEPLFYGKPDVGPAGVSQLVARPRWWARLPRSLQDKWGPRSVRPAGAGWLRSRLEDVPVHTGREVVEAVRVSGKIRLVLDDGTKRYVDHVLLGTGYRVDLMRYRFLAPEIVASIKTVRGYPTLSQGFETSVPGLHVVGAAAAYSWGPLMRFVAGSDFAARSVARSLRR